MKSLYGGLYGILHNAMTNNLPTLSCMGPWLAALLVKGPIQCVCTGRSLTPLVTISCLLLSDFVTKSQPQR